jgi:hypothetical protein
LIPEGEHEVCQFAGKEIRKICHNDEWYFCVIDVIGVMTDTASPRRYWSDLKSKSYDAQGVSQLSDKIVQLKFEARDGKSYATDAANTETVFRIPEMPILSEI